MTETNKPSVQIPDESKYPDWLREYLDHWFASHYMQRRIVTIKLGEKWKDKL